METGKKTSFMDKVAAVIVDRRNIIFFIFLMAALFCAFSRNWVQVCDDLTRYLPESTETRVGLDLMDREFTTFGTAHIMVENITYEQAEALQTQMEQVEGVKSVELDRTEKHYKAASALFAVTFDGTENEQVSIDALAELREELSDYDLYVSSNVALSQNARELRMAGEDKELAYIIYK